MLKTNSQRFDIVTGYAIKWCIFAVVFAAPFSKSISEMGIVLSITLWAIGKAARQDFRIPRTALTIPLAVFVLSMAPSFFNTVYPALSYKALFTKVLKYVAFYFVVVDSMDTKEKLKELFAIAALSMAVIMLDGYGQFWSGMDGLHVPGYPSFKFRWYTDGIGFYRGFPTACFPFPNDLAAWILLALMPLACAVIFDMKKMRSRLAATLLAVGLFHLMFLTKARGAWIGLAASLTYVALSKKRYWLILLMVIILAVPFILKMEMAQYIFGFSSVGDRFFMWGTSWEIFRAHPVIGSGLNTFFEHFKHYRNDQWKDKKGSYAHNCYLQMAADTGIVGLAGFAWLMLCYFRSMMRGLGRIDDPLYANVAWGISIGVFAFLIHSFFDTNLYSLNLVTLFWSAIAVSHAIIHVFEKKGSHG